MSTRDTLLCELKGQEVTIPDLFAVFHGWVKPDVSPIYKKLIPVSNARLESIFSDQRKLKGLIASDFAFFAATWWHKAKRDELTILMYFAIWLFNWDDEIDEPTGSYADDLDGAERYRSQTIDFVLESLGLEDQASSLQTHTAQNKIIASFKEIGEPLAKAYTVEQRQRFISELIRFMSHTKHEQEIRLRSEMPTIEEYWSFRMGTSAVGVVVAAQEFAMNVRINETVMRSDPRIKAITDETIINVVIVNDLLSLKKEISKSCIDSLVPIYCSQGMSVHDAIDIAVESLAMSRARFDTAARSLRRSAQREPAKYKHVSEWIEGCQMLCVGNLEWSLETGRYGVKGDRMGDGSVRFTL